MEEIKEGKTLLVLLPPFPKGDTTKDDPFPQ